MKVSCKRYNCVQKSKIMDISTFDAIALVGGLSSIIGLACQAIKERMVHPSLPCHYNLFGGYRTKKKGYHIVIIRNGKAGYTKDIAAGFRNYSDIVFKKTEYALCFHEYEGSPYSNGDKENKELINKIKQKYPELESIIVTIGTQVTISARNYLPSSFPIIAIGIGNPEQCKNKNKKDCNIAMVRYGIGVRRRIKFLQTIFDNFNKELKFVFIYNEKVPQDALMVQEVKRIANEVNDIIIETYSMSGDVFPEELDKSNIVCFGFYHLNDCLINFLKQAKDAVFIGLSPRDTIAGAIASTENDDYKLGEISVEKILVPKIIRQKHLSEISLINPDPYFTINTKVAYHRGFKFTKQAKKQAAEIINFHHNYN